jgi:dethiobiotin synthetase
MAATKQCPALFVSGTDTGVGKTLVAAALARHFSAKGLKVGVIKPVETGVAQTSKPGPDAELLRWAAQSDAPDEIVAPYRFPLAAAPAQAANAVGEMIDCEQIVAACRKLRQESDLLLVEGAGGLMVPLRGGFLVADLVLQLQLQLLVVSRPTLGTLNHTLLTTFCARTMEIELAGLVINRMPEKPGAVEAEAPHLLASLASADLLGVLPEVTGDEQHRVELLAERIAAMPGYRWLLGGIGLSLD